MNNKQNISVLKGSLLFSLLYHQCVLMYIGPISCHLYLSRITTLENCLWIRNCLRSTTLHRVGFLKVYSETSSSL